jgi:hypothetical protein
MIKHAFYSATLSKRNWELNPVWRDLQGQFSEYIINKLREQRENRRTQREI